MICYTGTFWSHSWILWSNAFAEWVIALEGSRNKNSFCKYEFFFVNLHRWADAYLCFHRGVTGRKSRMGEWTCLSLFKCGMRLEFLSILFCDYMFPRLWSFINTWWGDCKMIFKLCEDSVKILTLQSVPCFYNISQLSVVTYHYSTSFYYIWIDLIEPSARYYYIRNFFECEQSVAIPSLHIVRISIISEAKPQTRSFWRGNIAIEHFLMFDSQLVSFNV